MPCRRGVEASCCCAQYCFNEFEARKLPLGSFASPTVPGFPPASRQLGHREQCAPTPIKLPRKRGRQYKYRHTFHRPQENIQTSTRFTIAASRLPVPVRIRKMSRLSTLALVCLALCCTLGASTPTKPAANIDPAVLNFALNLEYLEANFYSCAAYGKPIDKALWGGGPAPKGCKKALLSPSVQLYAEAIARDEIAHVVFLRAALGKAAVRQPLIDIGNAFSVAADVALNTTLMPSFDAYGSDVVFLHAAFIFEDVGVTAYKGAARLITNKDYLEAAAGILATEAYHGGAIRALLLNQAEEVVFPYGAPVKAIISAIATLRSTASGATVDQGLFNMDDGYVVAPGDKNAVAFSRSTAQVLSVVTLGGAGNKGGFFPNGLNGLIK